VQLCTPHSVIPYAILAAAAAVAATAVAAAYVRIMQELLVIFRRFASDAARDSSARASAEQIRRSRFPRFPLDARRRAETRNATSHALFEPSFARYQRDPLRDFRRDRSRLLPSSPSSRGVDVDRF